MKLKPLFFTAGMAAIFAVGLGLGGTLAQAIPEMNTSVGPSASTLFVLATFAGGVAVVSCFIGCLQPGD